MAYGFIYKTTNNVNGKMYIGQKKYGTQKEDMYLGSGTLIKRAINKYGAENFSRVIIDEANSREELNELEKYWINYYNAVDSDQFYNIAAGGEGGNTIAGYSEEELAIHNEVRNKALKLAAKCGEESSASKLTENQVKDIIKRLLNHESTFEIADVYGVAQATISDIRRHATWCELTNGIEFPDGGAKHRLNSNTAKAVKQLSIDGELIAVYPSAREADRVTGVGWKHISSVCRGLRNTCGGFKWAFA